MDDLHPSATPLARAPYRLPVLVQDDLAVAYLLVEHAQQQAVVGGEQPVDPRPLQQSAKNLQQLNTTEYERTDESPPAMNIHDVICCNV